MTCFSPAPDVFFSRMDFFQVLATKNYILEGLCIPSNRLKNRIGLTPPPSKKTNIHRPLGTNISPCKGTFEDDFPFPQVGYGLVPWRLAPEN